MNRPLLTLCFLLGLCTLATAQTEVTTAEAQSLYGNTTKKRISIHDPSVVYHEATQRYYIFGSHKAGAYTTDLKNWTQANPTWRTATKANCSNQEAFVTPAVKQVPKGGEMVDFPQFNAVEWSARTDASYNVDGNMWAPDVIWNPTMQKWCMYLSINGNSWYSNIVLLTADQITGPYLYQGPVVICGFRDATHSYKDTDLELVLGEQASLPSRYARTSTANGQMWGDRWPHTIDPAVFYDEDGLLWLVYGSWSGGIWMLRLNAENGLRDYDVTYPSTGGSQNTVTSDPYFGTKIAGGLYVSGEGPYIEHIGQYYYLFVSYGGFAPDGGYEMRVFRSEQPTGPYRDALNRSAIFTQWVQNYGLGTDNRGEKLMGAYNQWGFQTVGETAQGHNSVIAAQDGRTYLVYHTKFNDGTAGHQVRVHQLFQNKQGWLVAAPFEYNGEETTQADIDTQELVSDVQIPGTYQLLVHKYKMDYANMEEVTPVEVTLGADGTVSGAYNGTWSREAGTSYLTLKLGALTYNGVITQEQMDQKSIKAIAFTAMTSNGVNVWGYKMHPQYAVAWHVNNQKAPVSVNQQVYRNTDLYAMDLGLDNVSLEWSSSQPDIISSYGRYNPTGLADNTPVTLTARLTSADYYWQQSFDVTALSEQNSQLAEDWTTGLLAHYGFDDEALANSLNAAEHAQLLHAGSTATPTLEGEQTLRNGNVVHLSFGANGAESYVAMPNPLYGRALTDGATLAFWVRRSDANLWDALYAFTAGAARLYMTGNIYTGFNDGQGHWIDINHPNTVQPKQLSAEAWHFVVITFERTVTSTRGGVIVYVDGTKVSGSTDKVSGALGETAVSRRQDFEYDRIVDLLAAAEQLQLGRGSFWGSPDARFDDVILYDRALTYNQVTALGRMVNRVYDFSTLASGIAAVTTTPSMLPAAVYDLQGRQVVNGSSANRRFAPGLYIVQGRKVVIR